MVWPFPKREYHTKWYWHSHAAEEWLTDAGNAVVGAVTDPVGTGVGLIGTGVGLIGDLIDPDPPTPPVPETPPACNTYYVTPTELKLRSFDPDQAGSRCNNTLTQWLETERIKFCSDVAHFTKDPGGGTCKERNEGQAIAREYCGVGARIKSASCTSQYLGPEVYPELAAAYCQTDDGKADQWCTCYNVVNGVCDSDPNAAGCAAKTEHYDPLVAATPDGFKSEWIGRESCYGLVCQQEGNISKWIPEDPTRDARCSASINICGMPEINAENLVQSDIITSCNIDGVEYDENGYPIEKKDEDEDEGFMKFIPTSTDDFSDPTKMVSVGVSSVSSCMCLLLLVLVVSK
jgi:hypothetical protein